MVEPVKAIFFCTESDYPKFLKLVPSSPLFRPTFAEFVSATNEQIERQLEQVSREKALVSYEKFLAYCNRQKREPDDTALKQYTFNVWGGNE